MKLKSTILTAAVAGALAVPFAAQAQSQSGSWGSTQFNRLDANGDGFLSRGEWERYGTQSSAGQGQRSAEAGMSGSPDLVVITMTPVEQRTMSEQRREAMFRAIDANGDGTISQAEAGLNTQLMTAFAKLDRNANGRIERQEFTRVHVDDGSRSSQASAAGGASGAREGVPSSRIEEKSKFSSGSTGSQQPGTAGDESMNQGSAAGGSSATGGDRYVTEGVPTRGIEERSRFSGVQPRAPRAAPDQD